MQRLIDLLRASRRAVAFTGAGVSTLSGIPDFRGEEGLYKQIDGDYVFDGEVLRRQPEVFFTHGRELVYGLFTLGLLFPVAVAILPLFIVIRQLGLLNTFWGVALPQAAFQLPISIVILRPFFSSIPGDLEEAAIIDGAGPLRFYWSVLLPLSRPVMSTIAVLTLVTSWNAFLLPVIVLTEPTQWTLPVGVTNYSTQYTTDTARVLAFTTLAMIPALIFYMVAERQIVKGLSAGAIKG